MLETIINIFSLFVYLLRKGHLSLPWIIQGTLNIWPRNFFWILDRIQNSSGILPRAGSTKTLLLQHILVCNIRSPSPCRNWLWHFGVGVMSWWMKRYSGMKKLFPSCPNFFSVYACLTKLCQIIGIIVWLHYAPEMELQLGMMTWCSPSGFSVRGWNCFSQLWQAALTLKQQSCPTALPCYTHAWLEV